MQQGCGHRQPLLEAARQLPAWQGRKPFQLELLLGPRNPLTLARAPQAIGTGEKVEVFVDAELTIERKLLGDVA